MPLNPAPPDGRRAIGFGLLGYGFMGRAHSHSLHSIGHMFWPSAARPELVAVCGRTRAGVAEAATRYGYGSYTTDWHDLVQSPAVEVFDNVTTDAAHVEPTLAAISAGKHVICEKPLASTAAECARLYEAATAARVKHMVCFNYRFFPAVRLAWELANGGELGELYQARFRYSQEWRTAPGPLPSAAGVQAIIACHAVDQARFLCGEIASVQAAISSPVTTPERLYRGAAIDQDDVVAMVARFDSGLVATIDASLVAPGRRNHLAWELNGSLGSVAWSLEDPNILKVYRHNGGRTSGFTEVIACEADHPLVAPWWPSGHVLGWEHGHANMLAHFIDAVAGDKEVAPYGATFLDGLRAAQVAEAVDESAETGDRVPVPPSPVPPSPVPPRPAAAGPAAGPTGPAPGPGVGAGAGRVSPGVPSLEDLREGLLGQRYFADDGILTAVYLALALGRPLLVEGEPGVGKTELARSLATFLGRELVRLQCYEGLDAAQALYEWDYPRQLLHVRAGDQVRDLYGDEFLLERPLLRAVRAGARAVLLVDEIDRSDSEFEAFLLEFLDGFQITVPERGTLRAEQPPLVIITSNRTRELHDAFKRRCMYHWIPFPEPARERAIIRAHAPGVEDAAAAALVEAVVAVRALRLVKRPGTAETIDWARGASALADEGDAWPRALRRSLGLLLKEQDDIDLALAEVDVFGD